MSRPTDTLLSLNTLWASRPSASEQAVFLLWATWACFSDDLRGVDVHDQPAA
ncbi:hypothetical protein [Streptosporangium sp. NPDC000396]|uniref:hypothetical protein n=1 Tax=Streptosporangium sp. NPDC000396 TaxID=3366185 RepID=UPI0036AC94F4